MLIEFMRKPFKGWRQRQQSDEDKRREVYDRAVRAQKLIKSDEFLDTFHEELDQIVADMFDIPGDTEDQQFKVLRLHARAIELNRIAQRLEAAVGRADVEKLREEMEEAGKSL